MPRAPNESVQNENGSGNDNSYRLHTTHNNQLNGSQGDFRFIQFELN